MEYLRLFGLSERKALPGKLEGSRRDLRRGRERDLVTCCMKGRGVEEEKSPESSRRVDG